MLTTWIQVENITRSILAFLASMVIFLISNFNYFFIIYLFVNIIYLFIHLFTVEDLDPTVPLRVQCLFIVLINDISFNACLVRK